MKAICVGHSTYDITFPLDKFPKENLKYRVDNHVECGGGPASNGAYLLSKWGIDTSICSIIGKDFYGDKVVKDFVDIGCNTKYLEQHDNYDTSNSIIIANMSNGSRTIITSKKQHVTKLNQNVNDTCDLILIDGEHALTAHEVLDNNKDAISVLDAGRLTDDTRSLGKKVTYVVTSKEFAEEFTNKIIDINDMNLLVSIYEEIKDYYNTNIIITLEENGSFTCIDGEYKIIPSVKVKGLDSTGAGDIFHGAFTYFIGMGYSLEEAIHYASITGAISVTRIGSRYSIPDLSEVLNYEKHV